MSIVLKKIVSTVCAAVLGVSCMLGTMLSAAPENESAVVSAYYPWDNDEQLPAERVSGSNRYMTAEYCAFKAFPNGAENAIVVSGQGWADALVGVPLAYKLGAPIILADGKTLDPSTSEALWYLNVQNVCILGGSKSVSKTIEKKLTEGDKPEKVDPNVYYPTYNTSRISGKDRYDTAVSIAKRLQEETKKAPETVFFVSASNFADALSVSTVAALKEAPVLYINQAGVLDSSTKAYLKSCKNSIKNAYVIGGKKAIADKALSQIKPYVAKTGKVERIAGANRYDTCVKVNQKFASCFGDDICMATGNNFPDALAGGVLAANLKAPMMLVGNNLEASQKSYFTKRNTETYYLLGGESVVPYEIAKQAVFLVDPKMTLTLSGKKYTLKWNKSPKVSCYEIYRQQVPDNYSQQTEKKKLKTITNVNTTSFTDTTADPSKDYYYYVKYVIKKSKDKSYSLEESAYSGDYQILLNSVKLSPRRSFLEINTKKDKSTSYRVNLSNSDWKLLDDFAKKHFTKDMTNADKVAYTLKWINRNVTYANTAPTYAIINQMCKNGTFSYVNAVFRYKVGQCNCYNGALVSMMCYLGYDAQLILGDRGRADEKGKIVSRWQHYWGEVKINGQVYVMEAGNYGQDGDWSACCVRYKYAGGYIKNNKMVS